MVTTLAIIVLVVILWRVPWPITTLVIVLAICVINTYIPDASKKVISVVDTEGHRINIK